MSHSVRMLSFSLITVGLLVPWGGARSAEDLTAPLAPMFAPRDPRSTIVAVTSAYAAKDVAGYAAGLSEDCRFFFAEEDLEARYPDGFTREDEIASASHLFDGFTDACGVPRAAAARILVDCGALDVYGDPDQPLDTAHYAVVISQPLTVQIELVTGEVLLARTRHAFWLVRPQDCDPCAPVAPGEMCWKVRRWVEEPSDALLASLRRAPLVACEPAI